MKPFGDFDLVDGKFDTCFKVALVNRILAEKLVTSRFSEPGVVAHAKLDRTPGPTIRLDIKPAMLISARHEGIDLRDDRRRERANVVAGGCRFDEFSRTQQDLDCFIVPPREVMKARFCRQGVCCFDWVGDWIQHLQRFTQVFEAALIAGRYERSRSLALQADACRLIGREGKSA